MIAYQDITNWNYQSGNGYKHWERRIFLPKEDGFVESWVVRIIIGRWGVVVRFYNLFLDLNKMFNSYYALDDINNLKTKIDKSLKKCCKMSTFL